MSHLVSPCFANFPGGGAVCSVLVLFGLCLPCLVVFLLSGNFL